MKWDRTGGRLPAPSTGCLLRLTGTFIALALVLASTSVRPALAAGAADAATYESLCMVTTTLDRRPPPMLANEPFEVRLRVEPHCLPRVYPVHVVFAMALHPNVQAADLREAERSLRRMLELLMVDRGERTRRRIGFAMASGSGTEHCALTDSIARMRSCLQRMHRLAPVDGEDEPLARAIRQADLTLGDQTRAWGESDARDVVIAVLVRAENDRVRPPTNAPTRGCPHAVRAAGQLKRRKALVIATAVGGPWNRLPQNVLRCLDEVASSLRYALSEQQLARALEPAHIDWAPHMTLQTRIPFPEHIRLESARVSSGRAELELRHPKSISLSSYDQAFEITLVLRATQLGLVPLSESIALDWQESNGPAVHVERPPIGEVLVLAPRQLATATPVLPPLEMSEEDATVARSPASVAP